MITAALFTVAKIGKQPKCPTDDWIKKIWYMYTMDYYSVIKKNEDLPSAATWIELEGIMLSEISQTEKDKYCMISLIYGIFKIQHTSENNKKRRENKLVITRGEE